ncbi:MAG: hypothetical protein ABI644_04240 [Arenimonas sp.]
MKKLSSLEKREPNEAANIAEMTDILRRKMQRDYEKGDTRRDAHPKTVALLKANFQIEADLPKQFQVGIFAKPVNHDCWVRFSNSSGKIQPDTVKDARGVAIKLMASKTKGLKVDTPLGQDFILLSSPVMPLGTVAMFRDAVYYTIESSPLLLAAKFFTTGKAGALLGLLALRIAPDSLLDIRYWSTTPYLFGKDRAVKYSLVPTSKRRSKKTDSNDDNYLSDTLQAHLNRHAASFDFCVQMQKDGMPIEDASVLWNEDESPFIKLATLTIPIQKFRSKERTGLAEILSFSPGNALPEHAPLGGLNRARIAIYKALTKFRHARDARTNLE